MNHLEVEQLVENLRGGDRRTLAQAITLIESQHPSHRESAELVLKAIMPFTGSAFRLGISGVPGVGKSTFIENFGTYALEQGARVAVLAVDPSSPLSGGSILGDKTRMENLARKENVFIRPSATGGTLGGVTSRTREALLLCEAAGFDLILVETVGIGQSETQVAQMTDMFVLLLLPGSGDDLQGIKRGVTELADLILINKADGGLTEVAKQTAADYQNAMQFLHSRTEGWTVAVKTCSALEGFGIDEVWGVVQEYRGIASKNNGLKEKREAQAKSWFWEEVSASLLARLRQHPESTSRIADIEKEVIEHKTPPAVAAQELVNIFLGAKKS